MVVEIPFVVLIVAVVLSGLWISNIIYDLNVPNYISRKIAHGAGGIGFMLFVLLFDKPWWPIIFSAMMAIMLASAKLIRPSTFRGVGGSGRESGMSEIWYPISGVLVFLVGWVWMDNIGLFAICFLSMAFGDSVTGLVRYKVVKKAEKHWSGSIAFFLVCLVISWVFVQPFWVGVVVSLVATFAEWGCGDVSRIKALRAVDDNIAISLSSLVVMLLLAGGAV